MADGTQRRVYVLPAEVVSRVLAFQRARGLPSEAEAVRVLLDEALKASDTMATVFARLKARLAAGADPRAAARDVLVGHPLVLSIGFERPDAVTFATRDGGAFEARSDGTMREVVG